MGLILRRPLCLAEDMPELYRSVNQATVASEAARLEAPQFVEIRGEPAARRFSRPVCPIIAAAGCGSSIPC